MLSGEGNENGEKTKIGLISKKATLHVEHTFFVHFFAVVLHDYNVKLAETSLVTRFMEEMSYVFLFNFVFHCPLIFTLYWWPLAFLILSPPLQDFHVVLSKNNVSSVFYFSLQTSVALFLVELRWPAAYFLSFSVFLLLYIPNLLQQEKKKNLCLTL